jgi:hypothetical protein
MDLMISSQVIQQVKNGVLLAVTAGELSVRAYVVIEPQDLHIVEDLVPAAVFESGAQVHVGGISADDDVEDQVVQILEAMDPDDVVVYLCDGAPSYAAALAILGAVF